MLHVVSLQLTGHGFRGDASLSAVLSREGLCRILTTFETLCVRLCGSQPALHLYSQCVITEVAPRGSVAGAVSAFTTPNMAHARMNQYRLFDSMGGYEKAYLNVSPSPRDFNAIYV